MFDGFVSWARKAAIPLPDPIEATPALRAFLREELAGKRVLYLGESDHFIHEKVDYRLAFARAARPCGFDWIGEEMGWSDGLRVDDWLHDRPGASLDHVTLFGFRGDERRDRDDSPTGILKQSRSLATGFAFEHRRLLEGLRELARAQPGLRLFGFDVDGAPGGAYVDLAARGVGGLDRVAGESLGAEIERLTRCIDEAGIGDPTALTSLTTLRDSLAYVAMAHPAPSWEALRPAMALRERVMHRHVDTVIDQLPAERGLVLWGHDLHLARDDDGITGLEGIGPGGGEVESLGQHVARRHPDDLYVVWMVCGRGEDAQPLQGLPCELRPPRQSLNALLARVGGSFLLPVRRNDRGARTLRRAHRLYHLYNAGVTVRPAEQVDALCFIERMTPLRTGEEA